MANNCTILVDDIYILKLSGIIENCHANISTEYLDNRITNGTCYSSFNVSLDSLKYLSDILFYIDVFDIDNDDCSDVHKAKEVAMRICNFTEDDISIYFFNAIISENGIPLLTESGTSYLQTES